MRSFVLSACVAAALFSGSAIAAGDGAAGALSYTWSGIYGGVNVGYSWMKSDWDFTSDKDNYGTLGLQVGYGGQIGDNYYLGFEGTYNAGGTDGSSSCFGTRCQSEVNSFGDISARLGVTSGPTLLFAKGGLAYEDTTYHLGDQRDGGNGVGFLLGGGIEYALLYNITGKLEYDYMNFGSDKHTLDGHDFDAKNDLNVVKLGFNMKFD
jgi:outer membrane immunogenic protein